MTLASTEYTAQLSIDAPAQRVFEILTSITAFAGWWAPATGTATAGGVVEVDFGLPDPLRFRVSQATPAMVRWEVLDCSFLPWSGTFPTFTLESSGGRSELRFHHEGLHSQLDCYTDCAQGWDQYLASLRDYIQVGVGNQFDGVVRVMRNRAESPL